MSTFHFSPRPNRAGEIKWRPYNEESFRIARESDRPVLVSISATWCHWCHVMDEETYSDDRVIQRINAGFVPIRVDSDRRPDIDRRYNMGGWPTTVFLTPGAHLMTGATFVAADPMVGLLDEVKRLYREEKVDTPGRRKPPPRRQEEPVHPRPHGRTAEELAAVAEKIVSALSGYYDSRFGGFASPPGYAPKFPLPQALSFFCSQAEKGRLRDDGRGMLEHTLQRMLGGEIFDDVDGGFFRYATRRDWSVPHYEKMTTDNAELLEVYLRAGRSLDRETWTNTARKTLTYVRRFLVRPDGAFGGSQDADEEYYRSPVAERGEAPLVDHTLYTDACARMAGAHLAAHGILGDREYRDAGLRALEVTEEMCGEGSDGLLHYHDDDGGVAGLLSDYVELALAHLDAHPASGERYHLERALELADAVRRKFSLPEGGFSDLQRDAGRRVGALQHLRVPLEDNARAALLCYKVGQILEDPDWEQLAHAALAVTAERAATAGPAGACWLIAHLEISDPAPHIRVGVSGEEDGEVMAVIRSCAERHSLVQVDDGVGDGTVVHVCRGTCCFPPASRPSEIRRLLHRTPQPASRH